MPCRTSVALVTSFALAQVCDGARAAAAERVRLPGAPLSDAALLNVASVLIGPGTRLSLVDVLVGVLFKTEHARTKRLRGPSHCAIEHVTKRPHSYEFSQAVLDRIDAAALKMPPVFERKVFDDCVCVRRSARLRLRPCATLSSA